MELKETEEQKHQQQVYTKQIYLEFAKKHELTPRESDIGKLLLKGYSNKGIAGHLNLKVSTIKYHTANVFVKLDITKRASFINSYLLFKNKN